MKRMRLAALILCGLILTVFFNYIYVRSVRTEMLKQLDDAMASDEYKVDTNNKTLVKLNKKIYEDILDTSYAGVAKAETTTTK